MANLSNIARPYALAAFETAKERQQFMTWRSFLDAGAYMVKQEAVLKLLTNPKISTTQLLELFEGVLGKVLETEQKNFLRLLALHHRLAVLPEIAQAFNTYYATLEKISKVRVVTAVEAKEDFRIKLSQALTKRIKHDVTLECEIDPSILGGAVIHMGDNVIDGSIRGKLTRLLEFSLR